VLAGDIDTERAFDLAEQYFGHIPGGEPPAPVRPTASLTRESRLMLEDRIELPRLYMAWHSPAMFAPGDAELDLAAHVLGGGKSSRLYKTLVFEQRLAQDAWAYQRSQALGSLFGLGLTAKPGQSLEAIEAATMKIIEQLATDGPTDEELERARNSHLADYYKGLDSLQTRADLLNHYHYLLGTPDGAERDVERYRAATRASVRDAFARVLAGHRLTLQTLPEAARA
jgi:zinc protease